MWYRQNYPNDYQTLLSEDKIYFINYLISLRSRFGDGNNFYSNLQRAMFTDTEINYNASPVQNITNLLSTNKNFEFTDNGDGLYQPEIGEVPVDMGIRGMIPKVHY